MPGTGASGLEERDFREIDFYRHATELGERAQKIIKHQVSIAQREGTSVACILFDLDHFWSLVEAGGPKFGQEILAQCNEFLRRVIRPGQAVSIGRDEFLILRQGIGVEQALLLAESVRTQLVDMLAKWSSDRGLGSSPIGCSAGVAVFPDHTSDASEVLNKALEGLYSAKQEGRNQTKLPGNANMILKSNYYSSVQLERLRKLAAREKRTEASILRQALEIYLRQHDT